VPRFPVAFQQPAFASRVILFPPGTSASLTVGLPVIMCPDPDGVSTFHTSEIRPGWVPSLPQGRRCSSRPDAVPDRRLPLPNGQSLHPAATTHLRGSALRGINEGSRDSPVRSAPHLWSPGGTGTLGLPPELRTPPLPATHVRGGATTRARVGNYGTDISRTSNPSVHSQSATSCRNGRSERVRGCGVSSWQSLRNPSPANRAVLD
jgi:hypothetical protein